MKEDNPIARRAVEKYGYIDPVTKEWVIKPMFDYACGFVDGCGVVKINDKYGMISRDLKWILPPFLDDIISGWKNMVWAEVGLKWGLLNRSVASVIASYMVAGSPSDFDESLKGMLIFSDFGDWFGVLQVNDENDIQEVDLKKEDYDMLAAYFEKTLV